MVNYFIKILFTTFVIINLKFLKMKKQIFILSAVILSVVMVFSSCKKDEDDAKSKKDILVAKTWQITAITINPGMDLGDGTIITDLFAFMDDCAKDDFMTFKTDGSYTTDEGASKCDEADPQTSQGTWAINADETQMTIDGEPATIKEMTENKLIVTTTDTEEGVTYTTSITLSVK